MKKLTITLMFISIFSMITYAANTSQLSLRLHNNSYFTVTFDNVFYKNTTNNFIANNLNPGNHTLKVSQKSQTYGNHQNNNVIFNGTIFIPGGYNIEAVIDKNNKFNIIKKTPLYNNSNDQNNNGGNNNQNDNWDNNNKPHDKWDNDDKPHHNSHHNNGNNNNPPSNNYSMAMNANDFHQMKITVGSKTFENTKLEVAKQATAANWLLSNQVSEIMQLFSFEATKLDYAKFAYDRTLDKEKYYLVNNAFTFESSITNLNKYIQDHK